MKPISAHFDRIEKAYERFAWWPVRSSFSQELIWMRKYVELHIFFDDQGRPPIKARNWKLIYTSHEYFLKKLSN
jgi:hypothetical protein